ncbi:MAG: hypothetical protein JWQ00_995 [Noviherbaspirillum sp.]|jgi:hypothetical protein|nr:hypothetical protein [Noviherbaspirillum sp.]
MNQSAPLPQEVCRPESEPARHFSLAQIFLLFLP